MVDSKRRPRILLGTCQGMPDLTLEVVLNIFVKFARQRIVLDVFVKFTGQDVLSSGLAFSFNV